MYYAGVDFGTSGCRLILIDQCNQLQYEARIRYPKNAVQSPQLWWQALLKLLSELPHARCVKNCGQSVLTAHQELYY